MSPDRLRECLDSLAWTQRGLARLLGRQEGTVRQWARGAVQIPPDVADWLEVRAKHAAKHPPPVQRAMLARREAALQELADLDRELLP